MLAIAAMLFMRFGDAVFMIVLATVGECLHVVSIGCLGWCRARGSSVGCVTLGSNSGGAFACWSSHRLGLLGLGQCRWVCPYSWQP